MKFWNLVGQAYGFCWAYCGRNFGSGDHLVQPSNKIFNIYIYICLYLYFIYIVFLVPTPISPTIKAYTMSQCELATLSQCLQVRLALKEYHIITVPIGLHYPSVPQTRLALSQCQPVPTTLSQCRRVMLAAITVPAAGSYHSASMVALSQCNHIALSQCKRSHYLSATLKETLSQCFG